MAQLTPDSGMEAAESAEFGSKSLERNKAVTKVVTRINCREEIDCNFQNS